MWCWQERKKLATKMSNELKQRLDSYTKLSKEWMAKEKIPPPPGSDSSGGYYRSVQSSMRVYLPSLGSQRGT